MLLEKHLCENSVDQVCIYFPDPWPNAGRDIGRRVVRHDILHMISAILRRNGRLHIVTDSADYAAHTESVMEQACRCGFWSQLSSVKYEAGVREGGWNTRPITKYELKAKSEGRPVWDYVYLYNRSLHA